MKKKIIFILGVPRCGSTLIGNILNEFPDIVHVGELKYIWNRGVLEDWICGNNKSFSESSFWQDVLKNMNIKREEHKIQKLIEQNDNLSKPTKGLRLRNYILCSNNKLNKNFILKNSEYIKTTQNLYDSIFKTSNRRIIIDSSKDYKFAQILLEFRKDYEIYFIHVLRKPQAVVFSRSKTKKKQIISENKTIIMGGYSIKKSSLNWTTTNFIIAKLFNKNRNYYKLFYENFVTAPQLEISKLGNFINESREFDNLFIGNTIKLGDNIVFSGNPSRFSKGNVKIKNSKTWKNNYSITELFQIFLYTFPLYIKYYLFKK